MVDKFHFAVNVRGFTGWRCEKRPMEDPLQGTLDVAQWRKWRTPVVYIANPRALHASMLFWSLMDPPG